MTILLLADGFEEVEAVTTADILLRSGIDVKTVSITEEKTVTGAHGIKVESDMTFQQITEPEIDCVILPGGMPGTRNLGNSGWVKKLLLSCYKAGKLLCAICAAPSVFGKLGLLDGKRAICYPGFEDELTGSILTKEPVVREGRIITSKAAGTAALFACEIAAALGKADSVKAAYDGMFYE